jgi:predicted chitinase
VINSLVFSEDDMGALLKAAYPASTAANREKYGRHMLATAIAYRINTPLRLAHWLPQLGHESAQLKYSQEIASGRAYEGRKDLGNTSPGDGVKHKDFGLIQLTGKNNQTRYLKHIGKPELIDTPSIIATDPVYATDSAGWFWCYGARVDLNTIADKDDFLLITRLINGGTNGIQDRKHLLGLARNAVDRMGARIVQTKLNAGRERGWPELEPDGWFGRQTASVVREMQALHLMKPTGIVDAKTWNVMSAFA